jgi:hypothetical protein
VLPFLDGVLDVPSSGVPVRVGVAPVVVAEENPHPPPELERPTALPPLLLVPPLLGPALPVPTQEMSGPLTLTRVARSSASTNSPRELDARAWAYGQHPRELAG